MQDTFENGSTNLLYDFANSLCEMLAASFFYRCCYLSNFQIFIKNSLLNKKLVHAMIEINMKSICNMKSIVKSLKFYIIVLKGFSGLFQSCKNSILLCKPKLV